MPNLPPLPGTLLPCFCPECQSNSQCFLEKVHGISYVSTLCCDAQPMHRSNHLKLLSSQDFRDIYESELGDHQSTYHREN